MSTNTLLELLLLELVACGGAFAALNGLLLGMGMTGPEVVAMVAVGLVLITAGVATAKLRLPVPTNG